MSQTEFDIDSTEGENQGAIHDIQNMDNGQSAIFTRISRDPDADAVAKFLQGEMACV